MNLLHGDLHVWMMRTRPLLMVSLLAAACGPANPADTGNDGLVQDVTAEAGQEIPTVVQVTWRSEVEATGYVRFGAPGVLERSTPATKEGLTHEVLLLGLLPDTDYAFQIVASAGEADATSEEQAFHTQDWLKRPPGVALSGWEEGANARGYTIVPIIGPEACLIDILDEQGRSVWAHNMSCGIHRARLALDGSGILTHIMGPEPDPMVLARISFTGEQTTLATIEGAHHDFTVVDDHTVAVLGYDERIYSLDSGEDLRVVGDTIIEVDEQGQTRVVWDLYDNLEPDIAGSAGQYDESEGMWDWSHCNYLQYVPADDAYYVSCRALSALFRVDRTTGEQAWMISDTQGDFAVDSIPSLVEKPHSIEPIEGGLLTFNQRHHSPQDCSEAVMSRLDEEAGTVERIWTYHTQDCLAVDYLGSAWPLPNGNTMVTFSQSGQIDEVTPEGQVVRRLNLDLGWWFAYAQHLDSLYP